MEFRDFYTEANENEKDLKKTLKKLPKSHQKLIAGFKYKFQPNNTLKGDKEHIGIIDLEKKSVTIAAPWNYGREYALLHELGHVIWSQLTPEAHEKWREILKKHPSKDSPKQAAEEYFAMCYANEFAHNRIEKFTIPAWSKFMQSICKSQKSN